jgi:hypothetical protein
MIYAFCRVKSKKLPDTHNGEDTIGVTFESDRNLEKNQRCCHPYDRVTVSKIGGKASRRNLIHNKRTNS